MDPAKSAYGGVGVGVGELITLGATVGVTAVGQGLVVTPVAEGVLDDKELLVTEPALVTPLTELEVVGLIVGLHGATVPLGAVPIPAAPLVIPGAVWLGVVVVVWLGVVVVVWLGVVPAGVVVWIPAGAVDCIPAGAVGWPPAGAVACEPAGVVGRTAAGAVVCGGAHAASVSGVIDDMTSIRIMMAIGCRFRLMGNSRMRPLCRK